MSNPSLPSETKTDLAELLRENCVRIQACADRAGPLAPLAQHIADALIALLTSLLNVFSLWREGSLPLPPAPIPAPNAKSAPRQARARRNAVRRRSRPVSPRPQAAREPARRPAMRLPWLSSPTPRYRPPPTARPVERYPKSAGSGLT